MFENMTETQARAEILKSVAEYYHAYKEKKVPFQEGDRITYAARVFDEKEMCALADATLDFWLTTGRFSDQFEKEFAQWLGVKYANLVNSGSSANLLAFMALTAQELGERRIKKGDEIITVACGFPTTVTPAIQYGAVPVFVDVTIPQYLSLIHILPRPQSIMCFIQFKITRQQLLLLPHLPRMQNWRRRHTAGTVEKLGRKKMSEIIQQEQ